MKDKILNGLMLLTVALALFFSLTQGSDPPAAPMAALKAGPTLLPAPTLTPAEDYRARRQSSRAQEQALLRALIQSQATTPEIRTLAEEQLLSMTGWMETELAVEAALAAKGYSQALCVAREGSVTILLPQPLDQQEAALILALAQEASGVKKTNIRIAAC